MFMGRLAQVLITLIVLLLHTSLQTEGAIGTTIAKNIPIQSMKLVGVKEESIVKTCKPCGCISGGKLIETNCCIQAHCNEPGEPLGTCIFTRLTCGCDESSCR